MTLTAIDLFAGVGGFTIGATQAGVCVLWAADYWQQAVEVHSQNHPDTEHSCQDFRQADFTQVPEHDVLLASPACQGHSNAATTGGTGRRGSAPRHDAFRSTAWAESPRFVVVENVVEFQRWRCFGAWRNMLEEDYAITLNVLDSADFGVPQHRKRLFVVGVRKRRGRANPLVVRSPERPYVGAGTFVQLDRGCWTKVRDHRSEGVRARVARARARGLWGAWLHNNVTGHAGRELLRPAPTVTTRHQLGVVRGNGAEYRPFLVDEYRAAMGFPEDYALPSAVTLAARMLGNAVVPRVASCVLEQIQEVA